MNKLFVALILVLIQHAAYAKSDEATGEWLQAKVVAEKLYQEVLQESIATQLDSSQFKINVYLNLSKIPQTDLPATTSSGAGGSFMPSLMGLVEADAIIQNYNGKLKELRQSPQSSDYLKKFKIDSAQITLGLKSEVYSPEYQEQLKKWLSLRTKTDLNVPVKVEVSQIFDHEKKMRDENKVPAFFKDYEKIILISIFSFTILVVAGMWFLQKYLGLRQERRLKEIVDRAPKQDEPSQIPSPKENEKLLPKVEDPSMGPMDSEGLTFIRLKLAKVFDSLKSDREIFIARLASGGPEDRLKASLLIDAWLHYWVENYSNSEKDLNWMIYMKGIEPFKFQLLETIEELKTISEEKIRTLIKEVYWDLLGFRAIGGKFISKPLSFLKSLEKHEMLQLFNKQNLKTKAFLFMNLSHEQKEIVKNSMDFSRFEELLRKQVDVVILKPSEIDEMHDEIKATYDLISNGRVNMIGRLPDVLRVLTTEEENIFISQNRSKFIEIGFDLRKLNQSVSTWPEWKDEPKRKIVESLTAEEIIVFVGMFSAHQDEILAYCSDFTKDMVLQDINENKFSIADEEKQVLINSINNKLKELIAKKEIIYENIFQEEGRLYASKMAS